MKRPACIPADYKRIKVVGSLSELFNEQFGGSDQVNAVLLPRALSGDFNALASWLAGTNYMREFTDSSRMGYPYFDAARLYAARKDMTKPMTAALDLVLQDIAPPYIHRAPALKPGNTPRLLLVAS